MIVAKADGTPLSVEVLGDYVSNILDAFGDGKGAPTQMYDRARLDAFVEQHLGDQADYKREYERLRESGWKSG